MSTANCKMNYILLSCGITCCLTIFILFQILLYHDIKFYLMISCSSPAFLIYCVLSYATIRDHTVPDSTLWYHTVPTGPYGTIHTIRDCMGPYSTIQYHKVPYSIIRDHTVPYGTIRYQLDHMGPYRTIGDHMGPYGTIWYCGYHTVPYGTIRYTMVPCSTIRYSTVPYGTIWSHTVPYVTNWTIQDHRQLFQAYGGVSKHSQHKTSDGTGPQTQDLPT